MMQIEECVETVQISGCLSISAPPPPPSGDPIRFADVTPHPPLILTRALGVIDSHPDPRDSSPRSGVDGNRCEHAVRIVRQSTKIQPRNMLSDEKNPAQLPIGKPSSILVWLTGVHHAAPRIAR